MKLKLTMLNYLFNFNLVTPFPEFDSNDAWLEEHIITRKRHGKTRAVTVSEKSYVRAGIAGESLLKSCIMSMKSEKYEQPKKDNDLTNLLTSLHSGSRKNLKYIALITVKQRNIMSAALQCVSHSGLSRRRH